MELWDWCRRVIGVELGGWVGRDAEWFCIEHEPQETLAVLSLVRNFTRPGRWAGGQGEKGRRTRKGDGCPMRTRDRLKRGGGGGHE